MPGFILGTILTAVGATWGQADFEQPPQVNSTFASPGDGLSGIAYADFDKDGDKDIVVSELRGTFPGSPDRIAVFYNENNATDIFPALVQ